MRVGWVTAFLLVAAVPARAESQAPLEQALAKASAEKKPLVIEFYADWCKPCRFFEQYVLQRADVVAALRNVEFVRYDIEASPGNAIADKLDVIGVPTFVVLDAAGKVSARQSGVRVSSTPHKWFLELLENAGRGKNPTTDLEAALAERPNDITARIKLGRHYRAVGRISDAAEQFEWIVEHAIAHRMLAAEAAAARDEMRNAEARVVAAAESAEKFIEAYPESPQSSLRVVALALSAHLPRSRVGELAKLHLEAVKPAHWPNAVRAALLADAVPLARASVQEWLAREPNEPVVRLIHAEEQLLSDERDLATREIEAACRAPGQELWCFGLRQAVEAETNTAPRLARLRELAGDYLNTIDKPKEPDFGVDELGELDERFGNALAIALHKARTECAFRALLGGRVDLVLELRHVGRPMRVAVRSREGGDLDRCVQRVIGAASLPTAPMVLNGHVHGAIVFPTMREEVALPSDVGRRGLMPQVLARMGDVETYGFRANAVGDIGGQRTLRALIGINVELAAGETRDGPAYAARGLLGFAAHGFTNASPSIMVGIGVSDLGHEAPRTLEVPVEARVRFRFGKLRAHVWMEGAYLFLSEVRNTDDGYGGLGLDELALGAGVSVPLAGRRVFVGGAYEQRNAGTGGMFMLGLPLGDYF